MAFAMGGASIVRAGGLSWDATISYEFELPFQVFGGWAQYSDKSIACTTIAEVICLA
jgi:hypothetical protein